MPTRPRIRPALRPTLQALYYTFHASLMLWNASFGSEYPAVAYWWRIERGAGVHTPLTRLSAEAGPGQEGSI